MKIRWFKRARWYHTWNRAHLTATERHEIRKGNRS